MKSVNGLVFRPGYGKVLPSWYDSVTKNEHQRAAEIGLRWLAEAPIDLSVEQRATRLVCAGLPLAFLGDSKGQKFLWEAANSLGKSRTVGDLVGGVWLDVGILPIVTYFRDTEGLLHWLSLFEAAWKGRDQFLPHVKEPKAAIMDTHIESRAEYHARIMSCLVTCEAFAEVGRLLPTARECIAKMPEGERRLNLEEEIITFMARIYIEVGPSRYDEALRIINLVIRPESRVYFMFLMMKAEVLMKMGRRDNAVLQVMDDYFILLRRRDNKALARNTLRDFLDLFRPDDLRVRAVGFPSLLWAFQVYGKELNPDEKRLVSAARPVRVQSCMVCSKELTKLSLCSVCKTAVYCGAECQKKDWKQHKVVCKKKE